jgi:hypothetical protein
MAKRASTWLPRPLLAQHNAAALIQTDDVERGLADIDTDYGDRAVEIVGHAVLLVFGAPCQIRGWRGRTRPGHPISGHLRRDFAVMHNAVLAARL